jgi:ribosome biogenesis GTPase
MVNALAGPAQELPQQTGSVREHDVKGRHTTTSRSLHAISRGDWMIDTPGMRTLRVSDAAYGIDTLFEQITELAPTLQVSPLLPRPRTGLCRPCAVSEGRLESERLARWRTMVAGNRNNTSVQARPSDGRPAPRHTRQIEAD